MLDESLVAAYLRTDYILFTEDGRELVLNIGRPDAAFDRILEARNAASAVAVSAYNPRSVVQADAVNRMRHLQLVDFLTAQGYDFAIAEGRDPAGDWPPEVGCFVFGIPLEAGLELARVFDQNAIVFVTRGGAPELAYPD